MTGRRIFAGVLLTFIIVTLLVISGAVIYKAGFTHGAMTNLSLPEGREFPMMPFRRMPLGWHAVPRIGLLGLFPLFCLGSFIFLLVLCGFGWISRRHAWQHYYGPGSPPEGWKHYGPPPWGPGRPPWAESQAQTESDIPSAEAEETKN